MSETGPLSLADVLEEEWKVIRPAAGPASAEDRPLSALCISGGGIRSATFALGALQGLAEQGLLEEFDYLSTVSGGGYIGSWLTSWKHRAGGLDQVLPHLRTDARPVVGGGLDPIEHLREYSNYLSPKLGLFSVDTWTLAATVIRNMFLNWLVFIPLLMAALLLPRLVLSLSRLGETFQEFYPALAHMFDPNILSPAISLTSVILFGIAVFNTMRYLPGVGRVQHSEFDFLKWVLLPMILSAIAFITNDSWFTGGDESKPGVDLPQLLGYWQVMGGVSASVIAASLACLAMCRKTLEGRLKSWLGVAAAVLCSGAIAGTVAWWLVNEIYPSTDWQTYTCIAAPLLLMAILLAGAMFVGFSSRQLKDEDREWLSRAGAWLLLYVVSWTGFSVLVLSAPEWVMRFPLWEKSLLGAAGGLGGWISALAGRSHSTSAGHSADGQEKSGLAPLAKALAAPVFAITVLIALSIFTNWTLRHTGLGPNAAWRDHQATLEGTRVEAVLALGAALMLFASLMARYININKFSLHAMYRNRLIRAYLGASNPRSCASKFTGFADSDNIDMHCLDPRQKPFHVVNVTLNLVSGQRLAWQQRKAESFTISPLHCGSADLGYRPAEGYGGPDGISLGTAVAISGAAASPNMGYNSSAVLAFIMTLFNARLGAWLGNPGEAGKKTWRSPGPTSALESLVREAFGLTNSSSKWVYLSDGGHFENLALYEMVRRRCRYIVVLDGGCDPEFSYSDLGNALRKIRIDMNVPVAFDEDSFHALRGKDKRYAFARILYSHAGEGPDGYLIYVKPMMRGNEPPDVGAYQKDHAEFPHETTANQFFNESQTESYRVLGLHSVKEICQGWERGQGMYGFFNYIHGAWKKAAASAMAT